MRSLALACALFFAAAAPAALVATSAPARADQAMLDEAKDVFRGLQTGDLDRSDFSDTGNMNLDADSAKELGAQLAPLGAPVTFVQAASTPGADGSTTYAYALSFKNGTKLKFVLTVDSAGKIAGVAVQPGG